MVMTTSRRGERCYNSYKGEGYRKEEGGGDTNIKSWRWLHEQPRRERGGSVGDTVTSHSLPTADILHE
jgi:hypothetical protein